MSVRPNETLEQPSGLGDDRYRRLIDAITDYAIYMLDVDGFVSSWNPGARRFKGFEAPEILGQHFSRFYTAEDQRRGVPQRALETAARENRFEQEGWRVRKDGSQFWAHVIIDPIRDNNGQLSGFAKITRDLTERKRAQESVQQAQHTLFQAQKLEAVGQLTGGIAHDFNNLMTAIIGCLDILKKRLPLADEQAHALLQNALHGAERGTILTQRMLAFARQQELKLESIALGPLVTEMLALLRRSLDPTIVVKADLPGDLPRILADANQVETALVNLLINARDAMPNGGTIKIAATPLSVGTLDAIDLPKGPYVCLMVRDEGHGMDAVTLARAAEPFFTTKGIGKGTGLGLSMVHGLAEQSGGRLLIQSTVGQGTTVKLILPVAADQDVPAEAPIPTPHQEPLGREHGVVLIVDDDDLVRISMAAITFDLGYTVLTASSGLEALDILEQRVDIAVVLTDQAMPGMTGDELAKVIAATHPNLPVILASGYVDRAAPLQGVTRLVKPFRQADLAAALSGALNAKVGSQSAT